MAAVKAAPHGLESSAFEIWVGRGRGGPLRQGFEAQGARPYRGWGLGGYMKGEEAGGGRGAATGGEIRMRIKIKIKMKK